MTGLAERSFTLLQGSNDGTLLTLADDVAAYLQHKRKKISPASFRGYKSALNAMVEYFPPEITLAKFEGPAGTRRIETFLAETWGFWDVLEGHIGEIEAKPTDYLLPRYDAKKLRPAARKELDLLDAGLDAQIAAAEAVAEILGSRQARATVAHLKASKDLVLLTRFAATVKIIRYPADRIGEHGAHSWWYRCLTHAGLVEPGTTAGTRMHQSRHTAAQRMLERTGSTKNAQALLGHATAATTETYLGWDDSKLEAALKQVLGG